MTARVADYLPQKINQFVPSMTYAADVVAEGPVRVNLGAPAALDLDGILVATDMTAAGNTTTFAAAYSRTVMGNFGRALTIDASGASTGTVTVTGRDYLGQPMIETGVLNGTTGVELQKAFAWIEKIAWTATASVNLTVGWNDILGLPYKTESLISELIDAAGAGFVAATAGTFAAADETTVTATTNDTRGTYLPNDIPDGTSIYHLVCNVDRSNLHGVAQYFA